MVWKIILGIIAVIALFPVIIYLLKLLAGLIAFCLGGVGLVFLLTGNIVPGLVLLGVALVLGIFAPKPDPDDWWYYWD